VEFRHGNLVNLDDVAGTNRYHVIFCRNVLIYFSTASRELALASLCDHLEYDGLLFVGPAETFLNSRLGFVASNDLSSFVYRKTEARSGMETPPLASPPRTTPLLKRTSHNRTATRIPNAAKVRETSARPSAPQADAATAATSMPDFDSITELANAGLLAEARVKCEDYLAKLGVSPRACCLMGVLEDAMGHTKRAIEFYRKAIYLDPNHAEALSHLALLLNRQGNTGQARQLRNRVRRIEERDNR
jgi:chemotaxis protein methyltransferase WspC